MNRLLSLRRALRPVKRSYAHTLSTLENRVVPRLLRPFNLSGTALVDGTRFKIPIWRGVGLELRNESEPWMSNLLRRLFRAGVPPGLVDVGVNVGQTLLKLKSIDLDFRYIGFEPNPFCVLFVQQLVELNHFRHCQLAPVALSDQPGLLEFIAGSDSDSGGSMITDLRPGKEVIRKQYIAALQFDHLKLDLHQLGIVKIDVEGAELLVLRGMKDFLRERRPCIVCEVLHAHSSAQLADVGARNAAIQRLLVDVEYLTYRVLKGAAGVEKLEGVSAFPDLVWNHASPSFCDYLMVPRERDSAMVAEFGLGDVVKRETHTGSGTH